MKKNTAKTMEKTAMEKIPKTPDKMKENTEGEAAWQEADESDMNLGQLCVYRNRKRAVELYRLGCSSQEIFRVTGMGPGMVSRLWKKCCAINPETGMIRGYQALVPRSKVKSFIR